MYSPVCLEALSSLLAPGQQQVLCPQEEWCPGPEASQGSSQGQKVHQSEERDSVGGLEECQPQCFRRSPGGRQPGRLIQSLPPAPEER